MTSRYILEVRAFNRFYTNIIGLLDKHILQSKYSLPEVRIMFELKHNKQLTASEIKASLDIDKGYLSRILKNFEENKLIRKLDSKSDMRATVVELTSKGKKEFGLLNTASEAQIASIFSNLSETQCKELVYHMQTIQDIINNAK